MTFLFTCLAANRFADYWNYGPGAAGIAGETILGTVDDSVLEAGMAQRGNHLGPSQVWKSNHHIYEQAER